MTLCTKWSSGAVGIRVSSSLSDHNSFKSVFPRMLGLIHNQWRFGRCSQHEKCSKLDFLPPWKFMDF
jgi:hypothetical protein